VIIMADQRPSQSMIVKKEEVIEELLNGASPSDTPLFKPEGYDDWLRAQLGLLERGEIPLSAINLQQAFNILLLPEAPPRSMANSNHIPTDPPSEPSDDEGNSSDYWEDSSSDEGEGDFSCPGCCSCCTKVVRLQNKLKSTMAKLHEAKLKVKNHEFKSKKSITGKKRARAQIDDSDIDEEPELKKKFSMNPIPSSLQDEMLILAKNIHTDFPYLSLYGDIFARKLKEHSTFTKYSDTKIQKFWNSMGFNHEASVSFKRTHHLSKGVLSALKKNKVTPPCCAE
ncbi:hypothetical protein PFISCL1PPCAC_29216, partial [Pristionchus fissidentatus]